MPNRIEYEGIKFNSAKEKREFQHQRLIEDIMRNIHHNTDDENYIPIYIVISQGILEALRQLRVTSTLDVHRDLQSEDEQIMRVAYKLLCDDILFPICTFLQTDGPLPGGVLPPEELSLLINKVLEKLMGSISSHTYSNYLSTLPL